MSTVDAINTYLEEVKRKYGSGIATEHAYRPALQGLIESLCEGINAINDAKRVEVGAPDFVLTEEKRDPLQLELIRSVPLGFVEAKDLRPGILDETKNKEQLVRYLDLGNVVHTDSLTFRFYFNRELVKEVVLGEIIDGRIVIDSRGYDDLAYYFKQAVSRAGRTIRTAKLLALHMADRARPIRRTILKALTDDIGQDAQTLLRDQYAAFKQVLIHDLEPKDFADIYAETIAYGLFAARYNDDTPENFSLAEAAQRVPQTNPFLRQFFLQIAAYEKDSRLDWVLNNFADLFSYADVKVIMSTYGKSTGMNHDPVTHFYETFLGEYDSKRRKARGVYYTPLPVVQHIVRAVDRVLRDDFGLVDGLADDSTVSFTEQFGDTRLILAKAEHKKRTWKGSRDVQIPRVQVLDPATGTSTFLNEIIKLIAERKAKKLGSAWSNYVEDNLLPRVHGFEILMAAYSMAHMRLGLTLTETGYMPSAKAPRLGVYLTNTLEPPAEYVGSQLDIFSSMGRAISEESHNADAVKRDLPIMIVMGNPPYSGHSSNNTKYANSLVNKYKVEPGGLQRLQEKNAKWLNDDYVKFIAYAEDMITKSGTGMVAMITNNGYLDNPTFRGMRWHLAKTFDKIYVLDLHGNSKKKEVAPDGGKDENVFDIQQGVGIIVAVKTGLKQANEDAILSHGDLYGLRKVKYNRLNGSDLLWRTASIERSSYSFVPQANPELGAEYLSFVSVPELFIKNTLGFQTHRDDFAIAPSASEISKRISDFASEKTNEELTNLYKLKDNRDWQIASARKRLALQSDEVREGFIQRVAYRLFDNQYTYFDEVVSDYPRSLFKEQVSGRDNIVLGVGRQGLAVGGIEWCLVTIAECAMDANIFRRGGVNAFPLWLYHDDGTRTANIDGRRLKTLLENLGPYHYVDEVMNASGSSSDYIVTALDVLDYVYGILHSPAYRERYKDFLRTDFPRLPKPESVEQFEHFRDAGRELRPLHLMQGVLAGDYPLEGKGSGEVEKLSYVDGNVHINNSQYFSGVPEEAWNFFIGGYQPAQKWLKDRKGQTLGYKDVEHYQRIVSVLIRTARIMHRIDQDALTLSPISLTADA